MTVSLLVCLFRIYVGVVFRFVVISHKMLHMIHEKTSVELGYFDSETLIHTCHNLITFFSIMSVECFRYTFCVKKNQLTLNYIHKLPLQ